MLMLLLSFAGDEQIARQVFPASSSMGGAA
jgi:hypothetical protein